MCLMHDSEEYGVLRWPLKDIAQAVNCRVSELRSIVAKDVLKGGEEQIDAFTYTPRHAGKDGDPVELLPNQGGPVWYSSRMVRDEYVRTIRGESTRFGEPNKQQIPPPKATPKPPIGDGASTSSSSSTTTNSKASSARADLTAGFVRFWNAWPKSERKQGKAECFVIWKRKKLEGLADVVVAHVEHMAKSASWLGGFDPMPETYLNKQRWDGADLTAVASGAPDYARAVADLPGD